MSYVDDLAILISGKYKRMLMNLITIESWCEKHEIIVHLFETEIVFFTRKIRATIIKLLKFMNALAGLVSKVKNLVVIFEKIVWNS